MRQLQQQQQPKGDRHIYAGGAIRASAAVHADASRLPEGEQAAARRQRQAAMMRRLAELQAHGGRPPVQGAAAAGGGGPDGSVRIAGVWEVGGLGGLTCSIRSSSRQGPGEPGSAIGMKALVFRPLVQPMDGGRSGLGERQGGVGAEGVEGFQALLHQLQCGQPPGGPLHSRRGRRRRRPARLC